MQRQSSSFRFSKPFLGLVLALTLVACDKPESAPPEPSGESGDWTSTVADYLDEKYPKPIMGMANTDEDAVVNYVARYPAEDHLVYVTEGASDHRFPHEFVMRIRFDTSAGKLDQRAPTWPDHVLAEIAEVEARTQRLFAPGDSLENVEFDGTELPYKHFVFYKDPKLGPLEGPGDEPLFFVQVIPLTDTQLATFNETAEGEPSEMMREWAERDPLFLVDAEPEDVE